MQEIRVCVHCNTSFECASHSTRRFCSDDCRYRTPEMREKKRKIALTLWDTPETAQKLREGIKTRSQNPQWMNAPHFQKGENHPRFTGAKVKRRESMSQYAYKKWRTDVFKRDNFTCQKCGQKGGYLNAHHIQQWANFPELRFELSNGITLCESCHDKEHGFNRKKKTYSCVVCGKPKNDGRCPRCHSCASKQGFRDDKRAPNGICKLCGIEFKKRRKSVVFCSNSCRSEFAKQQNSVTLICPVCKKEFSRYKSTATHQTNFCSRTCKGIASRGKPRGTYQ